jgi:hypothetical protein
VRWRLRSRIKGYRGRGCCHLSYRWHEAGCSSCGSARMST